MVEAYHVAGKVPDLMGEDQVNLVAFVFCPDSHACPERIIAAEGRVALHDQHTASGGLSLLTKLPSWSGNATWSILTVPWDTRCARGRSRIPSS